MHIDKHLKKIVGFLLYSYLAWTFIHLKIIIIIINSLYYNDTIDGLSVVHDL